MNVVGLGSAGCAMADALSVYPQYDIYKLDVGLPRKGNTYPVAKKSSHEEYDSQEVKLSQFMSKMNKDSSMLFIMAGGGVVSGASLQILKQLNKKFKGAIDIMYIKPDVEMLSELARKQDKICYRVLQEMTRSGVFRSMLLLSNPHVEEAMGETPIKNYYENVNNFIAYAYHMVNVFTHTKPEISSSPMRREEHVRLWTIGVLGSEKKEEKLFFPLDSPSDLCYYYGINESKLETDGTLLKKIRSQVKSKSQLVKAPCSYSIHPTTYEGDMGYVACWSSQIQAFPDTYQGL